jgi:hypothetical protein
MFKRTLFTVFLILTACQTTQEKNKALVRDRVEKLKTLSGWRATWCRVDAHLTQPALARYREMFPEESEKIDSDTWSYTWKARAGACEVTALETSPLAQNHRAFLEDAFCTLLQTHFVNSPFADLQVNGEGIVSAPKDSVQIRTSPDPNLGLYLDPGTVTVETRTKARGTFRALYGEHSSQWLPDFIEQRTDKTIVVLDGFEYGNVPVGGRILPKSFWISVGDRSTPASKEAFQHTRVELSNCRTF